MPPISKLKTGFLTQVSDCRALYNHCLNPRGNHTEAGIEASFLQMFKAWESLLEDCTVGFMCGRLRCDGALVRCHVTAGGEDFARRVIYQDRAFVEWTNLEKVMVRWESVFSKANSLEAAVRPAITELTQMTTIRNAIAHSSPAAIDKFNRLVQARFGGKKLIPRPSILLSTPYPPDPNKTYFDRYADVLEVVAAAITG